VAEVRAPEAAVGAVAAEKAPVEVAGEGPALQVSGVAPERAGAAAKRRCDPSPEWEASEHRQWGC
jgi:hypothetical protein